MIKFFRKIRQNMLSEGKSLKYLKYAIGEIVLVVIGILIALQINNWNESRKNGTKEKEYLEGIKTDLEIDVKYIDHFLPLYESRDAKVFCIRHIG
jgi:lipopolysaccharide/colanic/teichoic acid biosynthesis glycosyltransferase